MFNGKAGGGPARHFAELGDATMKSIAAISIVAAVVSACGGGGGSSATTTQNPPPVATSAEGLYAGTTSTGRTVTGIVLDDGTYYVLYSVANNSAVIAGAVQGTGASANGSFSSTNGKDINLEGLGVLSTNVTASYVQGASFNGSIAYPTLGQTASFTSAYDKKYESVPSLAVISGTYTGSAASPVGSENATITISSSGSITGTGASGCTFTGTVAPRAKGNAYNTTISFGGAPCLYTNTTFTGGAYLDTATRRLYSVVLTAARDTGFIFVGTKP